MGNWIAAADNPALKTEKVSPPGGERTELEREDLALKVEEELMV